MLRLYDLQFNYFIIINMKSVLITGCSTGLGYHMALEFLKKSFKYASDEMDKTWKLPSSLINLIFGFWRGFNEKDLEKNKDCM